MKLQIYRPLKYLSPTSFQEFLLCEYKFWLKRLSHYNWPYDPQGIPAAIGSGFDALIKHQIAKDLGLENDPRYSLELMMKNVAVEHKEYVKVSQYLFEQYLISGCYKALLKEGIAEIEMEKHFDGGIVKLFGKPDLLLKNQVFLDFKVNGAASNSGASPCQGYNKCWMNGNFKYHDKAGSALEVLNEGWAIQACFYNWIYTGYQQGRVLQYAVEQIAVRGMTVGIASFRTHISAAFQDKLWDQVVDAWNKINEGEFAEPVADKRKCFNYNQKCAVADNCPAFQSTFGNPELAIVKGGIR